MNFRRDAHVMRGLIVDYCGVLDGSDEDVRRVSKAKVAYQKLQVRNFTDKTTDQVTDVANTIGTKVSKVFKRTKKKVQGAIEGFKKE